MSKKPNGYWTEERIREEALKYRTKEEFKKGCGTAHRLARQTGITDSVCAHMETRPAPASKSELHSAALLYQSRTAFMTGPHANLYRQASRRGLLAEIAKHMPNSYSFLTDGELAATAKKYSGRHEFEKSDRNAYMVASRRKLLDKICAHMERRSTEPGYWTKEKCLEKALTCKTRYEFQRAQPAAYQAAYRNEWMSEMFAHMGPAEKGTTDTIYFWEAVGELYNGKRVYKIGVTSQHLGQSHRMVGCARRNGMEPRLLVARFLGKWYVPELEKYLLTFGEDPKLDVPDGKTEFRALTDEEVSTIIRIIESHPIL